MRSRTSPPKASPDGPPKRRRISATLGAAAGAVGLAVAGLYGYFAYAPVPEKPPLDVSVVKDGITVDGRERTYRAVVPRDLPPKAPLLIVFHGSNQDSQGMREATGYGFDRLAEKEGFIAVYPDGYGGNWNDCRTAAEYPARSENIDDNGLVRGLIARFRDTHGIDPSRVFAAGYSNGGQMVFRLAAEMPNRFAGLAAVAATQPTPDNFACEASGRPVPMLLVNGTADPIVPYNGGVVSLFGFKPRGTALSAPETARHFARVNEITASPTAGYPDHREASQGTSVIKTSYAEDGKSPVVQHGRGRGPCRRLHCPPNRGEDHPRRRRAGRDLGLLRGAARQVKEPIVSSAGAVGWSRDKSRPLAAQRSPATASGAACFRCAGRASRIRIERTLKTLVARPESKGRFRPNATGTARPYLCQKPFWIHGSEFSECTITVVCC